MPWKRKSMRPRRFRLLFIIIVVAIAGGFLAALTGELLHLHGPAMLDKYSPFKSLLKGYSDDQIRAAMSRRGQ